MGKRGFSLIEILISMTMFTLTMGGGLMGVRKGFEFVENARHYSNASQVLQSEVETLRTLNWADIDALLDDVDIALDGKYNSDITNFYSVSRKITDTGVQKKEIEVTISWKDSSGREHSIQYNTFFTEGGINDYYQRTI